MPPAAGRRPFLTGDERYIVGSKEADTLGGGVRVAPDDNDARIALFEFHVGD